MKVREIIQLIAAIAVLHTQSAWGAEDFWKTATSGSWTTSSSWTDGSVPTTADMAIFPQLGTYSVIFGSTPSGVYRLTINAGDVTFTSDSAVARNLNVTGFGEQIASVTGATTKLTLGSQVSSQNRPVNLVIGKSLNVQGGATLDAKFGSDITANTIQDLGLNGTVRLDGSGSAFTLTSGGTMAVGAGHGTGSFIVQNGATANNLPVQLNLADDQNTNSKGSVSVIGGSSMSTSGDIRLATQNQTGQVAALNVYEANSIFTQSGATTIVVGSSTNGVASINIGLAASGGTFTTGTGGITINKTGNISIGGTAGSDSNRAGIFNANGNLTIDGGKLARSQVGTFSLAAGRTMTLQNGGWAFFLGTYTTAASAQYNIASNSRFEVARYSGSSVDNLTIGNGANFSLTSGADLISSIRLDVGIGSSGTLTVDGSGSSAIADGVSAVVNSWGRSGGAAEVTFRNGATGSFSAFRLASSTTTNTRATVNIESGASVNIGSLSIATDGGTNVVGTLSIQGNNSRVTQASTGATTLTLGHTATGTATLNVGTTDSGAAFTTGTGAITIEKTGMLRVGSSNTTGTLNVNGPLTFKNGGLLEIGPGSVVNIAATQKMLLTAGGRLNGSGLIAGKLENESGVVSPGSSPGILTVNGNYLQSAGTLQLEIGGLAGGTQFDRFVVNGGATFGGTLNVSLINDFAPGLGSTFDLLDWQAQSGSFAVLQLPTLIGTLQWSTQQLDSDGSLSVISALQGDFSQDGVFNGSDVTAMLAALTDRSAYQTLRKLSATQLLAIGDFNNDAALTNADIQPMLNALALAGNGSLVSVPEPPSLVLVLFGVGLPFLVRRAA